MGEVWKALDHSTGAFVALKRLQRDDQEARRFLREAQLLERISHPALVAYVGHGIDKGRPFLTMAWIEGETLADRLEREPLNLTETLAVGQQLAGALSAIHAAHVVHRDLKPANVILRDGRADEADSPGPISSSGPSATWRPSRCDRARPWMAAPTSMRSAA
jgi:serine/threonine protein kinase